MPRVEDVRRSEPQDSIAGLEEFVLASVVGRETVAMRAAVVLDDEPVNDVFGSKNV